MQSAAFYTKGTLQRACMGIHVRIPYTSVIASTTTTVRSDLTKELLMHKKRLDSGICLIAVLMLALPALSLAQENSGTLAESWVMTVKQGQQADFEVAFKAHAALRAASGDPRAWDVYSPETGDKLNVYVVRTCCFGWADQDAYSSWTQSTPAVMGDWFANVDPFVESYAHYFSELDADNSNWPTDTGAIRYVGVTDYFPSPGQAAAFDTARKELSQVALNHGWSAAGHHWGWADRIGGEPQVSLAIPFNSFADMAAAGESFAAFAARTMGEQNAMDLMQRFTSSVRRSTYTIYLHRADLSTPRGE